MTPLAMFAERCRELDLSALAEKRPSIYFLVDADEIVYVGQTACVESRVTLHMCEGSKSFDRVLWMPVRAEDADAIEGALIRALAPKYCRRAPKDESRDAEILASFGMIPDDAARSLFRSRSPKWGPRARARAAESRARRAERVR